MTTAAAKTYEIFEAKTPHYACATAADVLAAKDEALRLERLTGLRGCFMIRELRDGVEHSTFPAFLSA